VRKKLIYYKVLSVLVLFSICKIKAQEKIGITNSNYSSTNSIFLNPSSSVDSKTYMQLNLAGASAFFYNNIAYLPWFSVWRLKRHRDIQYPEISDLKLKKFIYANAGIDGPAFVMSKGEYGAGVFARVRSVAEVKRVPYELTNALLVGNPYDNFPKEDNVDIKKIRASNMTWAEYGLNAGKMIKKDRKDLFIVGANLKYITGINIFYTYIGRIKGFYNDTMVRVDEISGKLKYNQPAWNSGRGFGADIGFTYKKMLKTIDSYFPHTNRSGCKNIDYKFKAAVSLRDLGYVRFTGSNFLADLNASGEFTQTLDTTQEMVVADLNLSIRSGKVLATLPTNISAQFDWNFENHIYLNGTIVKNLVPNSFTGVQSANLISICPRYEFKQFEVAMPFTLQKFMYPQLGFAFRIRSFVLGFDNIFPVLFMKPKTYGMGVYFNLAISLFKNPSCRKSQRAVFCPPILM